MSSPRRRAVLRGLALATTASLAGCSGPGGDDDEPTPTDRSPRVGVSYSAGGARCHDDVDRATVGWVHTVAHGERYDVTFDAILGHETGEEVSVELTHVAANDYELAFSSPSQATTEKTTDRDTRCLFGTRVTGGGTVPTDFETLRVTGGGERLLTIEREGTTPTLHRLPTPVKL